MKQVLTATALLLAVFLAGCNQDKAQVTEYLESIEASNTKMRLITEDLQTSMSGLQQEIASGKFDAEAIKGQLTGFTDKMNQERSHLESLSVPGKAQALHDAVLKQYDTAIAVMGETIPMIDIAHDMADAANKIKADPKSAKAVMDEMKVKNEELQKIQQKVVTLAEEGKKYEEEARSEQKKLQDEFGIATDGPEASGATTKESTGEPMTEKVAEPATETVPESVDQATDGK